MKTGTGTDRLLKISDIVEIVPLARSTIWRHVNEGRFPQPVRYGRSTFWKESVIRDWMDSLAA